MSGFDENIVREYFELNGFFVRQLRKYQVQSRKKRFDEEIDMLIYNPKADPEAFSGRSKTAIGFQLFTNDIVKIHQAVVVVKAWHSSRFTPAILRSGTKIFDFLKKDVLSKANDYFNFKDIELSDSRAAIKKILVIPSLPSGEPHRSESISLLKEQGIDGIISFATILEGIINNVEINHSYQKSDLLQLIRILKIYDMIKEPQMTFFD
ncbi:MAG: hypothetical protein DBX03_00850 [Puniceicoccaceae bacterium]|nr:MAG: hypothetical protein DBX03_00850 [Puniceicoccaceae bacterium]